MLSTCELQCYLYTCLGQHDAVYLYLRTVNQTLAEGNSDYRDGRVIINKTIGQRFVGKYSMRSDLLVDKMQCNLTVVMYYCGQVMTALSLLLSALRSVEYSVCTDAEMWPLRK